MNTAAVYIETFTPYRAKFVVETEAVPDGELFEIPGKETRRGYLSTKRIDRALTGSEYVATFAGSHSPNVWGLDVDDHENLPNYILTSNLLETYGKAIAAIGTRPSVLFQTPRGLHPYWFMTERIPYAALAELVAERIGGIPSIEFRPTPNEAIRIPVESRALNVGTLSPIGKRLPDLVAYAERFSPVELFDEAATSSGFRARPGRTKRAGEDMYRVEAETIPFVNGATWEPLTRLLIAYRSAGLSEVQASWRIRDVVLRGSPGYTGDLHNPSEYEKRIRYFWRSRPTVEIRPKAVQYTLDDSRIVAEIVEKSPFAKQRRRPIERFVFAILAADRYHRGLVLEHSSLSDLALWRWLYRYYERNVRRGYIPLPKMFLRRLNDRYRDLVPWLVEIGFLEPLDVTGRAKKGSYRAGNIGEDLATCRHYRVHRESFGAVGF